MPVPGWLGLRCCTARCGGRRAVALEALGPASGPGSWPGFGRVVKGRTSARDGSSVRAGRQASAASSAASAEVVWSWSTRKTERGDRGAGGAVLAGSPVCGGVRGRRYGSVGPPWGRSRGQAVVVSDAGTCPAGRSASRRMPRHQLGGGLQRVRGRKRLSVISGLFRYRAVSPVWGACATLRHRQVLPCGRRPSWRTPCGMSGSVSDSTLNAKTSHTPGCSACGTRSTGTTRSTRPAAFPSRSAACSVSGSAAARA
ncbi:hypothetical protein SUDANB106_00161 [Streptomyces sp. enrichment culture]